MSAMGKMIGMTVFAGFMAYWFDVKLGIHFISLTKDLIYMLPTRDIYDMTISLMFPLSFLFILFVTHAINITDGLDGLAGGICSMIIAVLAAMTFWAHIYTATAILVIVIAVLVAFLWYNIHPARVFMGDSGAFALG
jgi:UDP-N-acetylmuramyl pentapeptide phosphotransferase/UDP-N-acetylglucosamine-1-phosphate transferase